MPFIYCSNMYVFLIALTYSDNEWRTLWGVHGTNALIDCSKKKRTPLGSNLLNMTRAFPVSSWKDDHNFFVGLSLDLRDINRCLVKLIDVCSFYYQAKCTLLSISFPGKFLQFCTFHSRFHFNLICARWFSWDR